MKGIPGGDGMKQQRRKREIVDAVCLVTVSEISEILLIGNIGLCDDHGIRLYMLDQGAEQPNELVSLRKVDGSRTDLFPNKGHGIETEDTDSVIQMRTDNLDQLHEKAGF